MNPPRRQNPTEVRKLPPRTTCLALVLLSLGVTLLILAFVAVGTGHDGAAPLFFLSLLTLIPGGYASVQLLGVYRRWPGYGDLALSDAELV
mmetsp:Transcript_9842/g.25003  ORF Transcript_9842/g.25003 Transcript_9842/m.25003 type:complete len:91 (-) Transcript_9842:220-492(-)